MTTNQRRRIIACAHEREARRLDVLPDGSGACMAQEFRARAARLRNRVGAR
jgi:hypothetical protein